MKNSKIIQYGEHDITEDDIDCVEKVLRSRFLTQGPYIEKFEERFKKLISRSKYAIATSNATSGLHLACLGIGIKRGDIVLVPTLTFVATPNSARYCGAEIVFVDIDPETLNLCTDSLETHLRNYKSRVRAIISVNFGGLVVNTEKLAKLANQFGVPIIEDCCHAPGGYFMNSRNQKVHAGECKYSKISVFSFHPVKHICAGEGGMITTNDSRLYRKMRILRSHGVERLSRKNGNSLFYQMNSLGYNYRLTDIQCALGFSQLQRFNKNLERRHQIVKRYIKNLNGIENVSFCQSYSNEHAYHLLILRIEKRNKFIKFMALNNVRCQIHYYPCHLMKYYRELQRDLKLPNAQDYYRKCVSIPNHHKLENDEVDKVSDLIKQFNQKC